MKFGNWMVNEEGIKFDHNLQRFIISREQLLQTSQEAESEGLYKWILLAGDEDWLTDDDLYDLNFAFVYAAAAAGSNFDYETFDRTVAYQFDLLDEEEQSQPSLGTVSEEDAEAEQMRKEALTERD